MKNSIPHPRPGEVISRADVTGRAAAHPGRHAAALAVLIAGFGVLIHVLAIVGGPSWFAFFGAPPAIVRSAEAGTWLAPVGSLLIAAAMGLCGLYAASALGWVRRLPLLRFGLAAMASVCLVRALALIPLGVWRPALLSTFEIVAAVVWGLAGIGLAQSFRLARWTRCARRP